MSENICPEGVRLMGVEDMEHGAFSVRDDDRDKAWCCFCHVPLVQMPLSYWHRTEGMEPEWVIDEEYRPKRIQRQRTKGWRMPPNTVYVGRPSKWGNNYRVGDFDPDPDHHTERMDAKTAADYYAWALSISPGAERWAEPLRGKDLVCWCPLDQPCHADVLLELANA